MQAPSSSSPGAGPDSAGQQSLAFTLGAEEYGIDILKVQEIRGYEAVTRVANVPDFIKGVINLRGIIIPVIDMRIKFKLGTPVYDRFTVVIILNLGGRIIGLGTVDERMLILVDLDKLMSSGDMRLIANPAA